MSTSEAQNSTTWIAAWLDAVVEGSGTMSQRSLASVEKRAGGLESVISAAEERGLHLLQIEDDRGIELLVASIKSFKVLC